MRTTFEQLHINQEIQGMQLMEIVESTHRYANELADQRASIDRQKVMLARLCQRFMPDQGSSGVGSMDFGPHREYQCLSSFFRRKWSENDENGAVDKKWSENGAKTNCAGWADLPSPVGAEDSKALAKSRPTSDSRPRPTVDGREHGRYLPMRGYVPKRKFQWKGGRRKSSKDILRRSQIDYCGTIFWSMKEGNPPLIVCGTDISALLLAVRSEDLEELPPIVKNQTL
ncbi:hypothetical protein M9H77_18280 [Catharanthus roseus]|uniref:Uncharacterized protein n=1 Tax=Catharanthus roseus TaxID=4058 RepID=A0ACC0B714_CATRO|nr:hypothetical protein M9H77_18280 [Catharanthus roseus]